VRLVRARGDARGDALGAVSWRLRAGLSGWNLWASRRSFHRRRGSSDSSRWQHACIGRGELTHTRYHGVVVDLHRSSAPEGLFKLLPQGCAFPRSECGRYLHGGVCKGLCNGYEESIVRVAPSAHAGARCCHNQSPISWPMTPPNSHASVPASARNSDGLVDSHAKSSRESSEWDGRDW